VVALHQLLKRRQIARLRPQHERASGSKGPIVCLERSLSRAAVRGGPSRQPCAAYRGAYGRT
jgi:hypothetical protein